ncbi:LysM peptidoglycan-binding domain-containing protein [Blastococcus saxobsidens]|uniref:LysM peptidoglycan-binding domain-containing protein n=1 Tax=Blastococcus saxobsidens TaxID=138336 RepID=UPI0002F4C5A0|nr:LysM domain-containing protein [Blastococcus saxobsidens]
MTAVAYPAVVLAAASAVTLGSIAPAAAHTGEHTVRSGDTLSKLAAGHGTSWRSVYADNRGAIGANPNALRVGQVLSIGGSGAAPSAARSAPSASGTYVVRSGDTLARIAARHGTTWQQLHALNRQVIGGNPNVLRVGQRLVLSGAAAPAAAPSAAPPRATRSGRAVPAPAASPAPAAASRSYGAWDSHVRPAVQEVAERFGVSRILTRPGHTPTQGRAADFMVYTDRAKGDAVAQYVIDNAARLGVESVIWRQRIAGPWTGWTWQAMADRGSPTANHMDHPHVAFR